MSSKIELSRFTELDEKDWDRFVLKGSANGTFLHSRRFLSYHKTGKFQDCSLVIRKGQEIIAVVPACVQYDANHNKQFISHAGSTFGGLIVSQKYLAVSKTISLVECLDSWLVEQGFSSCVLKQTSAPFCRSESCSIEYALQHEGYAPYGELSFVIQLDSYPEPVENNFTSSRRRDCRYGEKAGCRFAELSLDEEIASFYSILEKSLLKYDTKPVHTLSELLDFRHNRLTDETEFYGVKIEDKLIAGSMVFTFNHDVFHTQYLAADPDYLDVFPMNVLDWNLIKLAKSRGYRYFSFGISTEDHGRKLNSSLATFKEGFGCNHSMNWTFTKRFEEQ